jgi:cytochrome c peroxidase
VSHCKCTARCGLAALSLLVLLAPGCKHKAGKFPKPVKTSKVEAKKPVKKNETPTAKEAKPLPADFEWLPPDPNAKKSEVPLRFVHAGTNRAEWDELKEFWNTRPPRSFFHPDPREVLIKVPLGLDDPTPHIPASNPPTLGKWELGQRLFFDSTWLSANQLDQRSCASCHQPDRGFTRELSPGKRLPINEKKVATLVNCVYNEFQFWDGRVTALEQVVQRTLEDEREPEGPNAANQRANAEKRHVWSGVQRLRANRDYEELFLKVFGTPPTQDTIGKALATYLRTILVGGSVYDRAHDAAKGKVPTADQYRDCLGFADLDEFEKIFGKDSAKKDEVAKVLVEGHRLFHGAGRCLQCHSGASFTDNGFHNIGIGTVQDSRIKDVSKLKPDEVPGRFGRLPAGLKDVHLIGAFKTPTLRALPARGRFFHDGSGGIVDPALVHAVIAHINSNQYPYVDHKLRDLKLADGDMRALAMFLHALDGKINPVITSPQQK